MSREQHYERTGCNIQYRFRWFSTEGRGGKDDLPKKCFLLGIAQIASPPTPPFLAKAKRKHSLGRSSLRPLEVYFFKINSNFPVTIQINVWPIPKCCIAKDCLLTEHALGSPGWLFIRSSPCQKWWLLIISKMKPFSRPDKTRKRNEWSSQSFA